MHDGQSPNLTRFNLISAVVLVLFSLLALIWLVPTHVAEPSGSAEGLGARFMPDVSAAGLLVLSLLLGANVLRRLARGHAPIAEDNEENDVQGFGGREAVNALILVAGSALYMVLLQFLGFVASSAILLAICLRCGGVRNWLVLGALSLGLPLGLSELLWRLLMVIMPPFPYWF